MIDSLTEALHQVEVNIACNKYKPLPYPLNQAVRAYYRSAVQLPQTGYPFKTKSGLVIAEDYSRLVVGDYGAYLEFRPEHIKLSSIKQKWPGIPSRPVKYIWWESVDSYKVKVYEQKGAVSYADYKAGMWYIAPADLVY